MFSILKPFRDPAFNLANNILKFFAFFVYCNYESKNYLFILNIFKILVSNSLLVTNSSSLPNLYCYYYTLNYYFQFLSLFRKNCLSLNTFPLLDDTITIIAKAIVGIIIIAVIWGVIIFSSFPLLRISLTTINAHKALYIFVYYHLNNINSYTIKDYFFIFILLKNSHFTQLKNYWPFLLMSPNQFVGRHK